MILMRPHLLLSCSLHAALITVAVVGASTPEKPLRRLTGNVLPALERPAAATPIELPAVAPEPQTEQAVLLEPEIVEPFVAPDFQLPPEKVWERAGEVVVPKDEARLDLTVIRLPRPVAHSAPEPVAESAEATTVITVVPGTNQPPKYPPIARRHGWQGTVLLRVRRDGTGIVAVDIVQSSGRPSLDQAALAAVREWKFEGGPGELEVPIEFRLRATPS